MAKVLSSISGNLISAASAGFAPTNSGDVSAIASAYQVVSATGTQLYAGTAHVTSINSAPISASRAGNAANASMANSAYYDGTGRLISSLPDAAEVSAIASAYADDKLDKTAEVVTATAGDGTYVTSINGMGLSGQGGGGTQVVTATGSASATAFTGGWPGIETSYLVSSINGSAILSYGYDTLSSNSAKWTSTNSAVSANSAGWTSTNSAVSAKSANWINASNTVILKSAGWTAAASTVSSNSAHWNSVYNTVSSNSASWSGSTGGGSVTSPSGTIFVSGDKIEGTNSAVLTASSEPGFTTSFAAGDNIPSWTAQELYAGTLPGSGATLYIPSNGPWGSTAIISGRDSTMAIVTASGLASEDPIAIYLGAIVSQISASANNYISITGDVTAEKEGGIQVTGIAELAWKSAVDDVTNTVSSNSATWGQGGVDSATVSAIASSYAESAASSKADSSSLSSYAKSADVSSTISTVSSNSASWNSPSLPISGANVGHESAKYQVFGVTLTEPKWTAAYTHRAMQISHTPDSVNYSGIDIRPTQIQIYDSASTATVDISSIDRWNTVSSKADSSSLSSYALSADVSGTVDLVSTQSANWGGSALALSAGPGVKLEKVGSTLVASTDETVLWTGNTYVGSAGYVNVALSEAAEHFESVKIEFARGQSFLGDMILEFNPSSTGVKFASLDCYDASFANMYCYFCSFTLSGSYYTELSGKCGYYQVINGTNPGASVIKTNCWLHPYKIVGVNRTAGV